MKNKKHIFITGGAGYAGSSLVPDLLEKNYKVAVYIKEQMPESSAYEFNYKDDCEAAGAVWTICRDLITDEGSCTYRHAVCRPCRVRSCTGDGAGRGRRRQQRDGWAGRL